MIFNTWTKILITIIVVLLACSGFLYIKNTMLEAKNDKLESNLNICSANLCTANKKIIEVNNVNAEQNKIIAKYNSMKKKDYKNVNDSDLDALHNLDVLLESKSIID